MVQPTSIPSFAFAKMRVASTRVASRGFPPAGSWECTYTGMTVGIPLAHLRESRCAYTGMTVGIPLAHLRERRGDFSLRSE